MIEERVNIKGTIGLDTVKIYPVTQEKTVIPSTLVQVVLPDENYDALSKVTIDKIPDEYIIPSGNINITANGTYDVTKNANAVVNVPEKVLGTKTITRNGTYNASDDNLDGYSQVDVSTSGVDINDYLGDTITSGNTSNPGWISLIKKLKSPLTITGTNGEYMFYNFKGTEIPNLDTSNLTKMNAMFNGCSSLTTIPQLDTSNVTGMAYMFANCKALTTIPQLDTSQVTNMGDMFSGCSSLTTIPQLNTQNITNLSFMFANCETLITIPQLDTSKIRYLNYMFYNCSSLTTIPLLNTQKVDEMVSVFINCQALTTLGGFLNLGQAYSTTQSENYSRYNLELSTSGKITHDSLMNVINNLYDIAAKGCNTQRLILGSINLTKLTSEEIAIATTKGWTVS